MSESGEGRGRSAPVPAMALPAAFRLVALDSIDSTNEEAKRLARAGAADGTLVWARRQTAGKGRRGRAWSSPDGNLYVSAILRRALPPASAAQLSFVTALAVGDTVRACLPAPLEVRLKWPNDVLAGGRKVAGILLESETAASGLLDWLVVGVGLNVQSAPQEAEHPATALADLGGRPADPAMVLVRFAESFRHWLGVWQDAGFAPVRQAWLAQAHGVGAPVRVRLDRESFEGIFADLDAGGALLVDLPDGRRRSVSAGDVFFGGNHMQSN